MYKYAFSEASNIYTKYISSSPGEHVALRVRTNPLSHVLQSSPPWDPQLAVSVIPFLQVQETIKNYNKWQNGSKWIKVLHKQNFLYVLGQALKTQTFVCWYPFEKAQDEPPLAAKVEIW